MKRIRLKDAMRVMKVKNKAALSADALSVDAISGVSIDSREDVRGKAFFAIKGENFDGHDFVVQAFDKGCALAVVKSDYKVPPELGDRCILMVDDVLQAMQKLAVYYLSTLNVIKAAVTGSVGKTSTREMMYSVFSTKYKTVRNIKNYNNEIGIPLTIFSIEKEHEAVIFEMGMDHKGEIKKLTDMVRPDFAVITKIGVAHIDNLGSREGILEAKWEITEFFDEKSALIVSSDDDLLLDKANGDYPFATITVGTEMQSYLRVDDITDSGNGAVTFRIFCEGETAVCRLNVLGKHNVSNAALAIAAGSFINIPLKDAVRGLLGMRLQDKRLTGKKGIKNTRVIDDTYNANTDSMIAGLETLKNTKGPRKIAILADMLGLGSFAKEGHSQVGKKAVELGIDIVICVGEHSAYICESVIKAGGKTRAFHFDSKQYLLPCLDKFILEEDVILVKGSRGMKMEEIVEFLTVER